MNNIYIYGQQQDPAFPTSNFHNVVNPDINIEEPLNVLEKNKITELGVKVDILTHQGAGILHQTRRIRLY